MARTNFAVWMPSQPLSASHPPIGSDPVPQPIKQVKQEPDTWRPHDAAGRFEINQRGQLRTRNYDASKPLKARP